METIGYFEHTADIGMEVCADDLRTLLIAAIRGMTDLIVPDAHSIRPREKRTFTITAETDAFTFADVLRETLRLFGLEGFIANGIQIEQQASGAWTVELEGEILDTQRHELEHEVKAVTYHELAVEKLPSGPWRGRVIFDI